jgi:hypothetical protein
VTSWWLIVDALAVYRLVRLVQRDTITNRPRAWLNDRYAGGWLMELTICPWCLSVWIAAAVCTATYFIPTVWSWFAAPLALSAAAGWLSDRER